MSIARAIAPACSALLTAAFIFVFSSAPLGADPPGLAPSSPEPSVQRQAAFAGAPRDKVRLVTAILIALSGVPISVGSQAVVWPPPRAAAGETTVRVEAGEPPPAQTGMLATAISVNR